MFQFQLSRNLFNARILSGLKHARVEASGILIGSEIPYSGDTTDLVNVLHEALHLAMTASYVQGLHLIQVASKEYDFGTDLAEVSRIWKRGCIIRSRLLDPIKQAYLERPDMENMLIHPAFASIVNASLPALRTAVGIANHSGVATTCLGATLAYLDSYPVGVLAGKLAAGATRQLRRSHIPAPGQGRRVPYPVEPLVFRGHPRGPS